MTLKPNLPVDAMTDTILADNRTGSMSQQGGKNLSYFFSEVVGQLPNLPKDGGSQKGAIASRRARPLPVMPRLVRVLGKAEHSGRLQRPDGPMHPCTCRRGLALPLKGSASSR